MAEIDPQMLLGASGLASGILAFGAIAVVALIAVYLYVAFALMAMAKRTNTPNGWLAFIPIANVYLMTQIAGLSGWYTLGLLLGIIPVVGWIALSALFVFIFWKIAENLKRPGWWGLLQLVPVVNLIMIGVMAWG